MPVLMSPAAIGVNLNGWGPPLLILIELFGNVEFFTFKLITWEIAFSTDGGICFTESNFILSSTVKVVFGLPADLFFFGLPPDFLTANSHDLQVW